MASSAATQSSNKTGLMSSPKDTKAKPSHQSEQATKLEAASGDGKAAANAPLGPPPKPSQENNPDYFSGAHGNTHFSLEPNPFEQSFGNPSTDTPSKFPGLPSVASLTSPAPLGPGGTPGWQGSLRSGPLSPAMLPGPTPANGDYFDSSFRQSFPTPNESSIRSGLTPGGGGSMFPAPSPNSQAIFNSMQSGGATPGTLDFHRTAMSAAARSKSDQNANSHSNTDSTTNDNNTTNNNKTNNTNGNNNTMQGINKAEYQPAQQQGAGAPNAFNNNSESDAVNSLYMLANNGNRNANQFAMANQPQGVPSNAQAQQRGVGQSQNSSPSNQRGHNQSIGSLSAGMSDGGDFDNEGGADQKASAKKGKKGGKAAANNRRKADDTAAKGPNKKAKGNSLTPEDSDDGDSIKDEDDDMNPNVNSSGKKLTDEEKRKNFLERNRVAALKCRQRKKQWLSNLQTKVELFSTENEALSNQNASLQEEIRSLKTILMAHKDCPVSHSQGLGGAQMANVLGADFDHPTANPYGMGMSNNGHMMMQHQGQGMQRS